ncbi:Predicted chitinase [Cupriavidus sp. OV038]|jgi:predicted chitinase|uniref:glycoside hydrolase family 19 protein n=1 Tax=unclassified Cupriavidus TaxID=2640874 RepID=UPI0008ED44A0|nr:MULTISPECIES: chitinase [unclassified Cupriavidus]SFC14475.1 Predicted chitinase [Cupriavidus sp. OV038]SFP09922.1 Predicted chitinase [Cupriavidus sp. OV096]
MTATPSNPTGTPPLKKLNFAFPFRKASEDQSKPSKDFTDAQEFHGLLRKEIHGAYPVSREWLWHGGIHVTDTGAGSSLDLKHGVRCMADGAIVAWRLNKTYLVDDLPAEGEVPAFQAQYSSGFALVRHVMEFPADNSLTFHSLYMHLQDFASYELDESQLHPAYWTKRFRVASGANDKPNPSASGTSAPPEHTGLRVSASKSTGRIIGILPRGAQFSLIKQEGNWGQIDAVHASALVPPRVGGFVESDAAVGGWINLERNGDTHVVTPFTPEDALDRIVVPVVPFPIKAGDFIGHIGRFDSVTDRNAARMVHLEVFAGSEIEPFIEESRSWLVENAAKPAKWKQLGLSAAPTILRIDTGTKLFASPNQEGRDAPTTGVIQSYSLAELAKGAESAVLETNRGSDGKRMRWWKVESADARRREISGWIREGNFAGGRVSREFAQKWVDFEVLAAPHDTAHTIFASAQHWADYARGADVPAAGGIDKLSPLMHAVFRQLYETGDGNQAANDLAVASRQKWTALRASHLIVRHESEWANSEKWLQLITAIEKSKGATATLRAEWDRIQKLVWWEEVSAQLPGLSDPNVFHIHPIAMIGNFQTSCSCTGQLLSEEDLQQIAQGTPRAKIQEYVSALNTAFNDYKFDTCISRGHFLAQILHESGGLNFTLESNGRGELSYDPWRGRGLIQITFKSNYEEYQLYTGEDVTSNQLAMEKLEQAPHALLSAAWFYAIKAKLIEASDADDFIWITRVINGGFNGYDHRLQYFNRSIQILGLQGCLKLNRNGSYRFEESKAYREKRASFAWGLWNDPGLTKRGIAEKTKSEAIKGYARYLELDDKVGKATDKKGDPKDKGWYGIGRQVSVRHYCETRLTEISNRSRGQHD